MRASSLVILALIFLFSTVSHAGLSSSYDLQRKKSLSKEQTQQERKSITLKNSTSQRDSSTKKSAASVEVSVDSLVFAEIAKLETQREPYRSCKLITNPPLPADFDITAEVRPDVIDLYKAEYLSKSAQSNINVSELADLSKLKYYVVCIAQYAEVISKVLQKIKSSYSSTEKLKEHISQLVQKHAYGKPQLADQIQTIDFNQCRFADSVNRIQCKQLYVEIANVPRLLFGKQKIFADSTYMNISAKFNVESSVASEFAKLVENANQTISEIASLQKEATESSRSFTVSTPKK